MTRRRLTEAERNGALASANLKIRAAEHFLREAGDVLGDPVKGRFNIDAALEALHSGRDLLVRSLRREHQIRERVLAHITASPLAAAILGVRRSGHHEGKRPPLKDVIRGGLPMGVPGARSDPDEGYSSVVIVEESAPPGIRTREWHLEIDGQLRPAIPIITEIAALLRDAVIQTREHLGMPPSD